MDDCTTLPVGYENALRQNPKDCSPGFGCVSFAKFVAAKKSNCPSLMKLAELKGKLPPILAGSSFCSHTHTRARALLRSLLKRQAHAAEPEEVVNTYYVGTHKIIYWLVRAIIQCKKVLKKNRRE